MKKLIFPNFAEASEWAQLHRCGTVRRISGSESFEWVAPENWSAVANRFVTINLDDPSTFPYYSFCGIHIHCNSLFLKALERWSNVSDDPNVVLTKEQRTLAWLDLETNLTWDAAVVFRDPHGTSPCFQEELMNEMGYAGFNDWRRPTIEELKTLLVNKQLSPKLTGIKAPLSALSPQACWCNDKQGDDSRYFDFSKGYEIRQRYIERDSPVESHYVMTGCISRCVRG